jgi:phosphonate transport system permease protein
VRVAPQGPGRPPLPVLLRWPGLAIAAAVALAWRLSEGSLSALAAPEARSAFADLARGFVPPAHRPEFLAFLVRPLVETVAIAFLGLALALALALPLAYLATSPPALAASGRRPAVPRWLAWAGARALLDVMRSIPEVVWALVLVRAVGMGPAAGVAAIGIGYAGILGKVFAEIFESTPQEAAGALATAGATPLGAFTFATLPSALPVAASYALYRFDCALRASAVLGLVGAGGIGVQLELSLKMLAYDEVATIVLALFALVASVDLASRVVRRRIRESRGLLPAGPAALRVRLAGVGALAAAAVASAAVLDLPLRDLLSTAFRPTSIPGSCAPSAPPRSRRSR